MNHFLIHSVWNVCKAWHGRGVTNVSFGINIWRHMEHSTLLPIVSGLNGAEIKHWNNYLVSLSCSPLLWYSLYKVYINTGVKMINNKHTNNTFDAGYTPANIHISKLNMLGLIRRLHSSGRLRKTYQLCIVQSPYPAW